MRSRYKRILKELKTWPWFNWLNGVYWMLRGRTVHCWKSRADVAEEVYGYGTDQYWMRTAKIAKLAGCKCA